jgi:hypothetical protein
MIAALTLTYNLKAITVRSDNETNMLGAINNRSNNASQQCGNDML